MADLVLDSSKTHLKLTDKKDRFKLSVDLPKEIVPARTTVRAQELARALGRALGKAPT